MPSKRTKKDNYGFWTRAIGKCRNRVKYEPSDFDMILYDYIHDLKSFGTKLIRRNCTVSVPQKSSRFRLGLGHRSNRGKFSDSAFYEISDTCYTIYFDTENNF